MRLALLRRHEREVADQADQQAEHRQPDRQHELLVELDFLSHVCGAPAAAGATIDAVIENCTTGFSPIVEPVVEPSVTLLSVGSSCSRCSSRATSSIEYV